MQDNLSIGCISCLFNLKFFPVWACHHERQICVIRHVLSLMLSCTKKKSLMLSIFLPSKCWGSFRNRSRNGEPHVCQEWGIIWIRRSPNSELYCSFPQRLDCLTGWEVTDEARTCRGLARTGNMAAWRSINLLFPRKEKESLSFFWLVAGSCSSSRALIGW